jgi:hypothetical protein
MPVVCVITFALLLCCLIASIAASAISRIKEATFYGFRVSGPWAVACPSHFSAPVQGSPTLSAILIGYYGFFSRENCRRHTLPVLTVT